MLADVDAVLGPPVSGARDVLRVECFLAERRDFPAWNRIWRDALRAAAPGAHDGGRRLRRPGHPDRAPGHGRPRGGARERPAWSSSAAASPGSAARTTCAATRPRGDGRREQPRRLGRLVRKRRLAVPRPGRPAARARADALRHARAVRPRLGALLQAGRAARLAPWLLRFWTYCNERDHAHGTAAIAQLGRDVFELIEEMRADGVEFELHRQGMVYAARSAETRARRAARSSSRCATTATSCPDDVIDGRRAARARAGAVAGRQRRLSRAPALARPPDTFTAGLAAALRRDGVEMLEGAEVIELVGRARRSRRCAAPPATSTPTRSCSRPARGRPRWRGTIGDLAADGGRQGLQLHGAARPSCRRTRSCWPTSTSAARPSATPADRRHDGVQRHQQPPRPAADRHDRRRRAGLVPALADARDRGGVGRHAADHRRRAAGPRPRRAARQHLRRHRLRDAGRDAAPTAGPGAGGDDRDRAAAAAARAVPARPLRPRAAARVGARLRKPGGAA